MIKEGVSLFEITVLIDLFPIDYQSQKKIDSLHAFLTHPYS